MRFALTAEHRQLFLERGYIEFEDLFSLGQLDEIVKELIRSRCVRDICCCTGMDIVKAGRNLCNEHRDIKKVVCSMSLAAIAAELFNVRRLRLGYDQVFFSGKKWDSEVVFFEDGVSLESISSVQGIVGGLILCLSGEERESGILPSRPGNGVYFKGDLPLDLEGLKDNEKRCYVMIAYCIPNAVYTLCNKDPHVHYLKKYDYTFGDLLREDTNPMLLW